MNVFISSQKKLVVVFEERGEQVRGTEQSSRTQVWLERDPVAKAAMVL